MTDIIRIRIVWISIHNDRGLLDQDKLADASCTDDWGSYRHVHSNIHLIRALSKDFYGRRMDWSTITCHATYPDSPRIPLEIDAPRSPA
jgi:hypothetical protein